MSITVSASEGVSGSFDKEGIKEPIKSLKVEIVKIDSGYENYCHN